MATPNYDIDYSDERLTKVESEKQAKLNEADVNFGNMIDDVDEAYQKNIDATREYADKQAQLQQERTDFTIDTIEQQKEQAHKDYLKEQTAAYTDWQKQSDPYGVNAEKIAGAGMAGTGYSESSKVSMYNTYQNRVAVARESYDRAVLSYNNSIKDAQLQNSSILAEIAYNALAQELELSIEALQYKNTLVLEKANTKLQIESIWDNKYQDVLQQINTENALAEEARQADIANDRQQKELELAQAELKLKQDEFELKKQQAGALVIDKGDTSGGDTANKAKGTSESAGNTGSKELSSGQVSKTTTVKKATSKATIDRESLRALGLENLTAAEINEMVKKGLLQEYEADGKIKFRRPIVVDNSKLPTFPGSNKFQIK